MRPTHHALTGVKYRVTVSRSGPGSMRLTLGGVTVDAVVRSLNDGGLLIQVRLTLIMLAPASSRQSEE